MKFIKWHKKIGLELMEKLGLDWYVVAWISWIKGLVSGFIIFYFLLL